MFLVVLLVASVFGDLEPTTTKTYDIEVPGSDPIRIIEGEPLWNTSPTKSEHRSFDTHDRSDEEVPLHQFLTNYADTVRRNQNQNKEEQLENVQLIPPESADKAKSWDMMQFQKHNHPYDDKKGWVSMEPVPWSVSKISKWESNYKPPTPRPWEEYDSGETHSATLHSARPWNRPSTNNYDSYYLNNKPDSKPIFNKPLFTKPTAVYSQKVHVDYTNRYQHKHDESCKHPQRPFHENDDIITDGLPSNFPQAYDTNRRQGTEMHPDSHPLSGEGEWVLLSTTKGYKYPQQRQRSLKIKPQSIGAHRGVKLTVLPPLKNSKVNMTTSHGGLLQVESTFQTVEQAHKKYTKKQKLKKKLQKPAKQTKPVRQVAVPHPVTTIRKNTAPTVTTTRKNTAPDSSAVLAAVGAGMIPATMAMLVPMALGGRRRREIRYATSTPKYLQVTLPRNLY